MYNPIRVPSLCLLTNNVSTYTGHYHLYLINFYTWWQCYFIRHCDFSIETALRWQKRHEMEINWALFKWFGYICDLYSSVFTKELSLAHYNLVKIFEMLLNIPLDQLTYNQYLGSFTLWLRAWNSRTNLSTRSLTKW